MSTLALTPLTSKLHVRTYQDMKTSVETQHNERDMGSSDENHTIKFWVVGSSIVKDLQKKSDMYINTRKQT